MARAKPGAPLVSNAPNFPSFYPVMHHKIETEIPLAHQRMLKQSFNGWKILIVFYYFMAILLTVGQLFIGNLSADYIGWEIMYAICIIVGTFFLVHYQLYLSVKKCLTVHLFTYYIFQCLLLSFIALEMASFTRLPGYPGSSMNINMLIYMKENNMSVAGPIICAVSFTFWAAQFLFYVFLLQKVVRCHQDFLHPSQNFTPASPAPPTPLPSGIQSATGTLNGSNESIALQPITSSDNAFRSVP